MKFFIIFFISVLLFFAKFALFIAFCTIICTIQPITNKINDNRIKLISAIINLFLKLLFEHKYFIKSWIKTSVFIFVKEEQSISFLFISNNANKKYKKYPMKYIIYINSTINFVQLTAERSAVEKGWSLYVNLFIAKHNNIINGIIPINPKTIDGIFGNIFL